MTTKEKIIRKSINHIEKKLKEIDNILNAKPLNEIFKIREQTQILLDENIKGQITSKEFMSKLEELSKRERQQFELAKKINSVKLIDKKVDLEFELTDLKNELFYITRE